MLYQTYDAHCDLLALIRAFASAAGEVGSSSYAVGLLLSRHVSATYELIARAGLTHERPLMNSPAVCDLI